MSAFKFKGKDGQDVIMDYSELLKLKGKDADSYLVRKLKSGEASPLNQIQGLDEQLGETNEQGDVLFRNPLEYAEIKKRRATGGCHCGRRTYGIQFGRYFFGFTKS